MVKSRDSLLDMSISVRIAWSFAAHLSASPRGSRQVACYLRHFFTSTVTTLVLQATLISCLASAIVLSLNWYPCFCLHLTIQTQYRGQNYLWKLKPDRITSLLKILQWLLTALGIKSKLVLPTFIALTTIEKYFVCLFVDSFLFRMSCYRRAGPASIFAIVAPVLRMVPAT